MTLPGPLGLPGEGKRLGALGQLDWQLNEVRTS
jgi:hypothetical protein